MSIASSLSKLRRLQGSLSSIRRPLSSIEPLSLHYESVSANENEKNGCTLFLHGLLGHGRNLKTFAKQACAAQGSNGYLMDLRGHGKSRISSGHPTGSHSFEACIQDLEKTITSNLPQSPDTLVGHSWGGRIALQLAATTSKISTIQHVWLLDTVPGLANESVEKVVGVVDKLQHSILPTNPISDKKELVQILTTSEGLDMATAQWLASSFDPKTGDFGFDLQVVQDILPDFGSQDFDGLLASLLEQGIRVDVVRGGKNPAWEIAILNRLAALERSHPHLFGLHVLPKAGHWVHVDDLKGLVGLFHK